MTTARETESVGTSAAYRLSHAFGPAGRPLPLNEHRARFPQPPQPQRHAVQAVIDEVDRSGLRGRGGAGFPTGTKLAAVAGGKGRPVVVVNGTEGEPCSGKDRSLMIGAPHLVIDGAMAAAAAVGADEVHICVERQGGAAYDVLRQALAERLAMGERDHGVQIVPTPPRFVAGEESALVHFINGGPSKPTRQPPRPFQKGVRGRPTLVNNAETVSHLAQIVAFGADWFRQCGPEDDPGTALVTLTGAVAQPGVYEIPVGLPLIDAVELAGGQTQDLQAFLVGGYFGAWISGAWANVPLDREHLGQVGAALGCGAIVALPTSVCGWSESARVLEWMAGESAGQCGPCVHGLRAIAGTAHDLAIGQAGAEAVANLNRWAKQVEGRGACKMPDGAVRFLRSALSVFGADIALHAGHRRCQAWNAPALLPIPASPDPLDDWAWR